MWWFRYVDFGFIYFLSWNYFIKCMLHMKKMSLVFAQFVHCISSILFSFHTLYFMMLNFCTVPNCIKATFILYLKNLAFALNVFIYCTLPNHTNLTFITFSYQPNFYINCCWEIASVYVLYLLIVAVCSKFAK